MNYKIEIEVSDSDDDRRSTVFVKLNDTYIGGGGIGGEPEDNSIYRDYDWIVPLVEQLSVALGAQVEVIKKDPE